MAHIYAPHPQDATQITVDGQPYFKTTSPAPSLSLARSDAPAVDADMERLRESDRKWAMDLAWQVGRTTK